MKRAYLGLLVVLLFAPGLYAQRLSLEEMPKADGYARKDLLQVLAPGFRDTLDALAREQGITPRADTIVSTEPTGEILITELDDPRDSAKRIFFFFLPAKSEYFFLQVRLGADGSPEMRLWAEGPSEILVSGDKVRLLSVPSGETFRLVRGASLEKISITDTISCIARGLGISVDSSSLTSRLASVICSASNAYSTIALVLTACNCLSIPSAGPALVFGVIGCINGITKLIACGIAGCTSNTCAVTTIASNSSTNSSWTSSCASTHRSGSYAKFYSFLLTSTTTVTIDLSSSADAYLYLLEGSGTGGQILSSDDDSGPGTDSRIVRTLGPGSYTIEATTYSSGRTGSFLLSLTR